MPDEEWDWNEEAHSYARHSKKLVTRRRLGSVQTKPPPRRALQVHTHQRSTSTSVLSSSTSTPSPLPSPAPSLSAEFPSQPPNSPNTGEVLIPSPTIREEGEFVPPEQQRERHRHRHHHAHHPPSTPTPTPSSAPSPTFPLTTHNSSPLRHARSAPAASMPRISLKQRGSAPSTPTPSSPFPQRHSAIRRSSHPLSVPAFSLGLTEGEGDREKGVEVAHVVRVTECLEEEVARILRDFPEFITADAKKGFATIHRKLVDVRRVLKTQWKNEDDRPDIDCLLDFDRLPWNFHNATVDFFRIRAYAAEHDSFLFSDFHCPSFHSSVSIPPVPNNRVSASVRLSKIKGYAGGETKMSVEIGEHDTATDVIHKLLELVKASGGSFDADAHVLKWFGARNYFVGDKPLFEHDMIRANLRHASSLRLLLVPTPERRSLANQEQAFVSKLKHDLPVLRKSDYSVAVPSANETVYDVPYLRLEELRWPYRVKICGVDGCSTRSLPQLKEDSRLFVASGLFYGTEFLPHSCMCTSPADGQVQPRWMQWLDTRREVSTEDVSKNTSRRSRGGRSIGRKQRLQKEDSLSSLSSLVTDEGVMWASLPRSTRVCFLLCQYEVGHASPSIVGWVVHQLVNELGELSTDQVQLRLWPVHEELSSVYASASVPGAQPSSSCNPQSVPDGPLSKAQFESVLNVLYRSTNRPNMSDEHASTLTVQFDEWPLPVCSPVQLDAAAPEVLRCSPTASLNMPQDWVDVPPGVQKRIRTLCKSDATFEPAADDKMLLWSARNFLVTNPNALPVFLRSVNWCNKADVVEARDVLARWERPTSPAAVLRLLDVHYHDYSVREYAVRCLQEYGDEEIQLFLLQMVQVLKFEAYHDSPLTRFLVERGLRNPYQVGHHLFWALKAEIHHAGFCERFGVILEEYLHFCGEHVQELRTQLDAVTKLQKVSEQVAHLKCSGVDTDDIQSLYRSELKKLNSAFFSTKEKFQVPLDPRVEVKTLHVDKCKFMSSKKAPLWLVFENVDKHASRSYVIFKSGDDLRQDILTLQLLRVMDRIWLKAGLDMKMKPYRVVATGVNEDGEGVGMIEVVTSSTTTSDIHEKHGGAFNPESIDQYLMSKNKGRAYMKAVQNFVHSCAGYCVATYILGIGDRHSGNIMLQEDGHIFHIDFGHFLGNFKSKFGINRERAAFVLTSEMAYVIGLGRSSDHPDFLKFRDLCSRAFNEVRKHGHELINLFVLMISAGMPELMHLKDLNYLKDKLCLNLSQEQASEVFDKEIDRSLKNTFRQLDNWFHLKKHGGKKKKKDKDKGTKKKDKSKR